MTNPTLRELVDMLPGEMQRKWIVWNGHSRFWSGGIGMHNMDDERAGMFLLGYLVRWLLERNCWLDRTEIWHDDGETPQLKFAVFNHLSLGWTRVAEGNTPLEAAVRAAGVIESDQ